MSENEQALVEALHREAVRRYGEQPLPPVERQTISCNDLPEAGPGEVLAKEWNTYRREVSRLLAEGLEAKFVLIKGETIVGIFETWDKAHEEGLRRYLLQPILIHEIRTREPVLRIRGYNLPCPG